MDVMGGCELCGSEAPFRCSRCKLVFYCSRDHQKAHWREHRMSCGQLLHSQTLTRPADDTFIQNLQIDHQVSLQQYPCSANFDDNVLSATGSTSFGSTSLINNISNSFTTDVYLQSLPSSSTDSTIHRRVVVAAAGAAANNDELQPAALGSWSDRLSSEKYLPSSAYSNGIGHRLNPSTPSQQHASSILKHSQSPSEINPEFSINYTDPTFQAACSPSPMELKKKLKLSEPDLVPYHHRNMRLAADIPHINNQSLITTMCHYVIHDMDKYGICVIDDFLGKNLGLNILREVKEMYNEGQFKDGQLMSNPTGNSSRTIRGDKILWVNGNEEYAYSIGLLIKLVDVIVCKSNRMPKNGKLGEYTISDRSKAMIACYPGGGTQYVKHVDNPNKDGRCITSIYYLNENWDVKKDGGLLRIFPSEWSQQVADIEPFFDRMLFFWSDRRNPHEVQPALRTRYAITLWYNDKSEKAAARQQIELGHQMAQQSPSASPEI